MRNNAFIPNVDHFAAPAIHPITGETIPSYKNWLPIIAHLTFGQWHLKTCLETWHGDINTNTTSTDSIFTMVHDSNTTDTSSISAMTHDQIKATPNDCVVTCIKIIVD